MPDEPDTRHPTHSVQVAFIGSRHAASTQPNPEALVKPEQQEEGNVYSPAADLSNVRGGAPIAGTDSDTVDHRTTAAALPRRQNPVKYSALEGGLRPTGFFAGRLAMRKGSKSGIWPTLQDLTEQDQRAHEAFWRQRGLEAEAHAEELEFTRLQRRLQHMANHGVTGVVFFANGKSIAKTRSLQLMAECLRKYLPGRLTDMMLATSNLTTSTLNRMSDIPPEDRKSVVEFFDAIREASYAREIREALPQTTSGAGVIGEMQANPNRSQSWGTLPFIRTALRLQTTGSFLLLDGGNDDVAKDSVPYWAARLAHAIVFVYKPEDAPVIATLRSDVASYRANNCSGSKAPDRANMVEYFADPLIDDRALALSGVDIPTPAKVRRSVVIAAKSPTVDLNEVAALMRDPSNTQDSGAHDWSGRAVAIPFQESLAGTRPGPDGHLEPSACIWENLDRAGQLAALRLTVAALEAIVINRGLSDEVGDLYRNETPVVIDES